MGDTEFTRLKKNVQKNSEEITRLNKKVRELSAKKMQGDLESSGNATLPKKAPNKH